MPPFLSLPLGPAVFNDEIDFLPNKALMLGFFILIALPNDPAPPLDDVVDPEGEGATLSEPPDLDDVVVETDNRWIECLFEGVEGVWGTDHEEGKTAVLGLVSDAETPICKRECGLEAGELVDGKTTRSSSPGGIGSDICGC